MHLPRATRHRLTPIDLHTLHTLRHLARPTHGILPRAHLILPGIPPEILAASLASLASSGHILLTTSHLADLSRVRAELKKEHDRNTFRTRHNTRVPPSAPFRQQIQTLFPSTRPRPRKPSRRGPAYTTPSAFQPLIAERLPHATHLRSRPADVSILSGPYLPSELHAYLQAEAEQRAAHRIPWLLYNRKSIHLGIQRLLHTP